MPGKKARRVPSSVASHLLHDHSEHGRLIMSAERSETHRLDPPLGQLERSLIEEFVRARGYDPLKLADLPVQERQRLLADASVYASGKLMEVEARSRFLDEIRNRKAGLE